MSKNDVGNKLAAAVRQARTGGTAPPAAKPAARPAAATVRRDAGGFARQTDQAPAASLDRPWANLHPARIWPD